MSAHAFGVPQAGVSNAADQLAELQLLTRADQHGSPGRELRRPPLVRGGSTLMLNIEEHPDEDDEEDEETALETTGSSSFTALLAASRRLAGSSPTHSESPVMATTPAFPHDDAGEMERDKDSAKSDPAFEEMIEHLHCDMSFLALSVSDLNVSNLVRARDAIAGSCLVTNCSQQDDLMDETKTPLSKMRSVRTMMALDTLRLFLLRHGEEQVLRAVTDALRGIFDDYARDHGVSALSHTHCVMTASNIARVVLAVRDMLREEDPASAKASHSLSNNNMDERASPPRSSSTSPSRWLTRGSRSPSSTRSPPRALSPGYTSPTSPRSPGSSSSSASLRRSILASDGAHVLMSEKLATYQHRGDVNRRPSFKVRRDGDSTIEEASRRRQRSIQYGNEATKALRT